MIYTISKKTHLGILILLLIFAFNLNVFGQPLGDVWNTTLSLLNISVDDGGVPNDPALQANKLNYIDTRFCNDGIQQEKLTQNLSMVIRPGEEKEICIIHSNRSKNDIYVLGSFPENKIYPNGSSDCSTNNTRENPFSKFIQPFENELTKVPAKGYAIVKTTIKFPKGINGLQRGCYAYSANQGKLVEGEILSIVNRKVHYIEVLVQGKSYTIVEVLKDIIIQNKNILLGILFIVILTLLILEIKKIKHKKHKIKNKKHI